MKKFVSVCLVLSMLLSIFSISNAAGLSPRNEIKLHHEWGYKGEPVLIDEFATDNYKIAMFYDGSIVYAITLMKDGSAEFSYSTLDGDCAYSVELTAQDLNFDMSYDIFEQFDEVFLEAAKEYGFNNMENSTEAKVFRVLPEFEMIQPYVNEIQVTKDTDDYRSLMNQLRKVHGPQRTNHDWAGIHNEVVQGKSYTFKENLSYGMTYRDRYEFSQGISLANLVINLISLTGDPVSASVIAAVLEITSAITTRLDHDGCIASYYGDAVYLRYVNINRRGPYYQCSKMVSYDGWVEEGNYYSAQLVETDVFYSSTPQIFANYDMQRDLAYANYYY